MPPSRVAGRPLSLPDWFPHAFGAALIIVVVSALTFAAIWMEASRSQREAEVSTQNLSLLVAEQVSGLYARADALILAAVNYHRDASRHGRIERTRINSYAAERHRVETEDYLSSRVSTVGERQGLAHSDASAAMRPF